MGKSLAGKIALVTGGGRGIGKSVSEALAKEGAVVAVHYGRGRATADETVSAIKASGGDAFAVQADLAEKGAAAKLFAALDAELTRRNGGNRFDILVNNAGIAPFVDFAGTSESTLDEIYAVNVKSPFLITQEAAKRLNDGGRVINFSSVVARLPATGVPAYSVLKAPIDNFTRALAAELGTRGITVNAVAPGVIDTEMTAVLGVGTKEGDAYVTSKQALKRIGKPDDVADVVTFLAGPHARWVTGQVIEVSGGTSIVL
jgi:NAD(P)-dependent dehydrogenase (short-subunit alcohol dehydrogenase family)